ncbi:MAG: radical SAM protein [Clostridia bacterium]|nr:radical SAM protein [Clostridia bacterium]
MKGALIMPENEYKLCNLCARECGVDRNTTVGFCRMGSDIYLSYYSLHKWEEPPISGEKGSGTIFFAGCSLGCTFCQNKDISRGRNGKPVTEKELSDIMLELQRAGAHNINFVTPTHYSPSVKKAILISRERGLRLPTVYNTGSYDSLSALQNLDGAIDIYLPDLKFYMSDTAKKYALAPDYPGVAKRAIAEMIRQVGEPAFDEKGIMKKGVIARILLLPGHVAEAKLILKYLYDTYGDKIYISLMNQYTPMQGMPAPLNRKVTREEYRQLVDYALRLGVTNAFVQEFGTASESFIPPFKDGISGI